MYVIICLRQKEGKTIPIPILASNEEDEISDTMATWDNAEEAEIFCGEHILCSKSQNIIVDLNTGDAVLV